MVYWQIYVARSHHCEVHRWLTSWILTNEMLGLNSLYALISYYPLQWWDNWKLYLWSWLWMITWFSLRGWIHPCNMPCEQQKRSQQHHVLRRQHMSAPSAGQLCWWDGFFKQMSHCAEIWYLNWFLIKVPPWKWWWIHCLWLKSVLYRRYDQFGKPRLKQHN